MMLFYDSNLVLIQATLIGLLLALSIQVPLRMGVFSFAGVGCYGIGAYPAGILVIRYDLGSPILSILLAAIVAAVVGLRARSADQQAQRPVPGHGDGRLRPDHQRHRDQRRRPHRRRRRACTA